MMLMRLLKLFSLWSSYNEVRLQPNTSPTPAQIGQ